MKSSSPLVSIVIPVYNGSNYLSDAIDSAINQTYGNIEVLVINDGSTDNGATAKIAKSYGKKIRYFEKPNGGVASALNYGIKKMKGEWFSWLSHDDVYYPTKIAQQIIYFKKIKYKKSIIYSDYDLVSKDLKFIRSIKLKPPELSDLRYYLMTDTSINGCTLLIPKHCFATNGYFSEHLRTAQDYEYWLRVADKYHFIHLPSSLVKSRQHTEQGIIQLRTQAARESEELMIKTYLKLSNQYLMNATSLNLYKSHLNTIINFHQRKYFTARNIAIRRLYITILDNILNKLKTLLYVRNK